MPQNARKYLCLEPKMLQNAKKRVKPGPPGYTWVIPGLYLGLEPEIPQNVRKYLCLDPKMPQNAKKRV